MSSAVEVENGNVEIETSVSSADKSENERGLAHNNTPPRVSTSQMLVRNLHVSRSPILQKLMNSLKNNTGEENVPRTDDVSKLIGSKLSTETVSKEDDSLNNLEDLTRNLKDSPAPVLTIMPDSMDSVKITLQDPDDVSDKVFTNPVEALDEPRECLKRESDSFHYLKDDSEDSYDELPTFLNVEPYSSDPKKRKKNEQEEIKDEKMDVDDEDVLWIDGFTMPSKTTYSIDQLLADHKETIRLQSLYAELEKTSVAENDIEKTNLNDDDLLPEHEEQLNKLNITEAEIKSLHPGETIFVESSFLCLFSYPQSLTLAACGFVPGQSRTDRHLTMLESDDLLEFLSPEFISLVFPAISSKESFVAWLFYLLSISPDSRTSYRIHRILYNVIHGNQLSWAPSILDVCRVFVNYGASFESLCPKIDVKIRKTDLNFTKNNNDVEMAEKKNERQRNGFKLENLKFILQIITDSITTRPEKYSYDESLTLALIILRISLDQKLSVGYLHLDIELLFASVINSVPPEKWKSWLMDFCRHATSVTQSHHNMVYLIGLMPLVERGNHLQRTLSLAFLETLLHLNDNNIDDFVEPKIKHSLQFLKSLCLVDEFVDFYLSWSVINLLEYSVGSEAPTKQVEDFAALVECLHQKISQVKDKLNKANHILLKDLMVLIVSKWNIIAKSMASKQLFAPMLKSTPIVVRPISSQSDHDDDTDDD